MFLQVFVGEVRRPGSRDFVSTLLRTPRTTDAYRLIKPTIAVSGSPKCWARHLDSMCNAKGAGSKWHSRSRNGLQGLLLLKVRLDQAWRAIPGLFRILFTHLPESQVVRGLSGGNVNPNVPYTSGIGGWVQCAEFTEEVHRRARQGKATLAKTWRADLWPGRATRRARAAARLRVHSPNISART